jgi:NAD+ kinase
MKIAIFGKQFNDDFDSIVFNLLTKLSNRSIELYIHRSFFEYVVQQKKFRFDYSGFFDSCENLPSDIEFLLSIGGDGTFLEAITFIRDSGIPIVGINSGRLGFLANIAGGEVDKALDDLLSKNYAIEERSVLQLTSSQSHFSDFPFAFNECTIQKIGSSLITIHVYSDGVFLNSYWTDGLIIATPTGSTAYSLSVGGPIVTPQSHAFIISPIAPHNLNVRPLIIPDSSNLTLTVEGRTNSFLVTLDSRSVMSDVKTEITLSKGAFPVRMIKLPMIDFYTTLRNKLMWGVDKRN